MGVDSRLLAGGGLPQGVQGGRAARLASRAPGVRRLVLPGPSQHFFDPARQHHRRQDQAAAGLGDVDGGLGPTVRQAPADRPGHDLVGPGRHLERLIGAFGDHHAAGQLTQRGAYGTFCRARRAGVALLLGNLAQAPGQQVKQVGPLDGRRRVLVGHQRGVQVRDRFP